MSGFLTTFRHACGESYRQTMVIIVLSLAVGCAVGYRILGPALFG